MNEIVKVFTELFPTGKGKEAELTTYLNGLKVMGIGKGLNSQQLVYFLRLCYEYKLDPIKKEIYAVTYQNKDGSMTLTPIISYTVFIKRASMNKRFGGGSIKTEIPEGNISKAYCTFTGKGKNNDMEFKRIFLMSEWNKYQGEGKTKPIHMLEKTAVKNSLAGMYPEDDLENMIKEEDMGVSKEEVKYIETKDFKDLQEIDLEELQNGKTK